MGTVAQTVQRRRGGLQVGRLASCSLRLFVTFILIAGVVVSASPSENENLGSAAGEESPNSANDIVKNDTIVTIKNDTIVTNNDVIVNETVKVKQETVKVKQETVKVKQEESPVEKITHSAKTNNADNMTTHDQFPYYGFAIIDPSFEPLGGGRYEQWKNGETVHPTSEQSDTLARQRRIHIKNAMIHAWKGYEEKAFGSDSLRPVSGKGNNDSGGISVTLLDSLDTLWLMNMKDEFKRARDLVEKKENFSSARFEVSVFETTIRCLGGLLAAYDWSGDDMFLTKATTLQIKLFRAFGRGESYPHPNVNLHHGRVAKRESSVSEVGSLQLEMRFLDEVTDSTYVSLVTARFDRSFENLRLIKPINGLYATHAHTSGSHGRTITFGAGTDSFYEYMLKLWLQGDKKEDKYREMYDKAIDGMHLKLLRKSSPSGLWFIGEGGSNKMEHLVCFMGGQLALGAYTDPLGLESERAKRDLKTARAMAYTCYQMFAETATGLSPDTVMFNEKKEILKDMSLDKSNYHLRPEIVETFFILNQLTGDPVYREWGWEIFMSIEKFCKTKYGYGSYANVTDVNLEPKDQMESYFLAETLKYLYLLMDPDTEVDVLNKHVFNTEGHPLRKFSLLKDLESVKSEL